MRSVCALRTVSCPASTMWQNFIPFRRAGACQMPKYLANLFIVNYLRQNDPIRRPQKSNCNPGV